MLTDGTTIENSRWYYRIRISSQLGLRVVPTYRQSTQTVSMYLPPACPGNVETNSQDYPQSQDLCTASLLTAPPVTSLLPNREPMSASRQNSKRVSESEGSNVASLGRQSNVEDHLHMQAQQRQDYTVSMYSGSSSSLSSDEHGRQSAMRHRHRSYVVKHPCRPMTKSVVGSAQCWNVRNGNPETLVV
jgi:hypothetical protein